MQEKIISFFSGVVKAYNLLGSFSSQKKAYKVALKMWVKLLKGYKRKCQIKYKNKTNRLTIPSKDSAKTA